MGVSVGLPGRVPDLGGAEVELVQGELVQSDDRRRRVVVDVVAVDRRISARPLVDGDGGVAGAAAVDERPVGESRSGVERRRRNSADTLAGATTPKMTATASTVRRARPPPRSRRRRDESAARCGRALSRSAHGHSPPSSRRSGSRRSARSCRTRRCGPAGSRPPGRRRRRGYTRWACCMLWVTMTTVTSSAISRIVSSMRRVEVGSRAEQGSSINKTFGRTARARRDAEALLLATGELAPEGGEAVAHLVPQAGLHEHLLHELTAVGGAHLRAGKAQAGEHVVLDGHGGEGVGLLEDHADLLAHLGGAHLRPVDVVAVQEHPAAELGPGHDLVHAVQDAQERRLATAGRPDEGRHLGALHRKAHPLQDEVAAEPGRDVLGHELGGVRGGRGRRRVVGGREGAGRDEVFGRAHDASRRLGRSLVTMRWTAPGRMEATRRARTNRTRTRPTRTRPAAKARSTSFASGSW